MSPPGQLGDLRVIGYPQSGRLEIFINRWTSVCVSGFDIYEADLVCNQLGFLYANRIDTVTALG